MRDCSTWEINAHCHKSQLFFIIFKVKLAIFHFYPQMPFPIDWLLQLEALLTPRRQACFFIVLKKSKCQSKKNTGLLFIFIWISKHHANSKAINLVVIWDFKKSFNDLKNNMLRKLLFLLRSRIKPIIILLGRNLLNLPSHAPWHCKRKSFLHHYFTISTVEWRNILCSLITV